MAFHIPIPSHSHSQFCDQFPFSRDSHWAFSIPSHSHSHSRTIVSSSLTHNHTVLSVVCLLLNFKTCQDSHHYWTSQSTENICWIAFDFDKNSIFLFPSENINQTWHPLMGIYSHGNKGHSHSHTGCFLFLPIPNFVINFHSPGIPMGFPCPLGIPFPWSSLMVGQALADQLRRVGETPAPTASVPSVWNSPGNCEDEQSAAYVMSWNRAASSSIPGGVRRSAFQLGCCRQFTACIYRFRSVGRRELRSRCKPDRLCTLRPNKR